jgi:DNA invertase Pin-like site-specific DNA recombinase
MASHGPDGTPAFGYVRVSTLGQAAEGVSLDAQREKVTQYCQLHGLALHETFATKA